MKKSLMVTAAAVALLAGPGLVLAQKNEKNDAPAQAQQPSAPAEKNAPAEKMAPPAKVAPAKGAETKRPDAKPQTIGQSAPKIEPTADKPKAEHSPIVDGAKNAQTPVTPAPKNAAPANKPNADVKASESKSDAKPSAAQAPAQSNPTTAQTATSRAAVNLTVEQRTQISGAIKQQNVPRATNVNFSISIGTRVPRTMHFYPLPPRVVEVYPIWRGYDYILVGNEILVIDPRTLEIVAVLEA